MPCPLPGRKKNRCRSTRRHTLPRIPPFIQLSAALCSMLFPVGYPLPAYPSPKAPRESGAVFSRPLGRSPTSTCSCRGYLWRAAAAVGCRLGACQSWRKMQPLSSWAPALPSGRGVGAERETPLLKRGFILVPMGFLFFCWEFYRCSLY